MKKAIIILMVIFLPTNLFAYDALTLPTESSAELVKNSSTLLQTLYNKHCVEASRNKDLEVEKAQQEYQKSTSKFRSAVLERALRDIDAKYSNDIYECDRIKKDITNQSNIFLGNYAPNLSCGSGYVKRGNQCVTHTQNCELAFGKNISGAKRLNEVNVSECTCNTGYKFDGKQCVMPQVKGAYTSNDALIAQLQTQIAFLIQQIALLKK